MIARPAASVLLALSVHSVGISVYSSPTSAPVPQVLAWVSFAGADGPISTTTTWSSGEAWAPVLGTWQQVGHAAVASSTANARVVARIPAAGDHERVVAVMTSRSGVAAHGGGVVVAANPGMTRTSLVAMVATNGALELRSVTGLGASSTLIATTSAGLISGSSIELTLQLLNGVATATARPVGGAAAPVVLMASPSAAVLRNLAGQDGYGVYANSTTDLAFTQLRVEVPL